VKRKIALALAVLAGTAATAAAASSPAVKTGSATNIKHTSAVLNGTVNPNGAATKYWFEWGLTTSYGSTSSMHSLSAGTTAVAVHLTTSGLNPGTRYHYRLFAQNKFGVSSGSDHTLKTTGHPLPVAATDSASAIGTTSATINGTVVPNGQSTPWRFEWGTSPTALNNVVTGATPVAATTPLQTVSTQLSGLAPGMTFYYRVEVNRSGFGWLPANTLAFTTLPSQRPLAGLHASTRPHRDRHKPFQFTTSGSISGPFPSLAQCNGTVAIRYFAAGHRVALRFVSVQPNCTFSHTASFGHTFAPRIGGKRPAKQTVRITIRFHGNGYLASPKPRTEFVVLG
jgi:hypothetical protein